MATANRELIEQVDQLHAANLAAEWETVPAATEVDELLYRRVTDRARRRTRDQVSRVVGLHAWSLWCNSQSASKRRNNNPDGDRKNQRSFKRFVDASVTDNGQLDD